LTFDPRQFVVMIHARVKGQNQRYKRVETDGADCITCLAIVVGKYLNTYCILEHPIAAVETLI